MKIGSIFVAGYRKDVDFTRCCVASIRRWYRSVPIYLIKDELAGPYDTSDLERHYDVQIFQGPARSYGWGMSKLEPLLLAGRERILILDSDTVFVGPVLDRLEEHKEDFVVAHESLPENEIHSYYFHPELVEQRYPGFRFPGFVFNTGQIVATTGIIRREHFIPFVRFTEPRALLHPDVFFCGEQGLLNFLVFRLQQDGVLTVGRGKFMEWAGRLQPDDVEITKLGSHYNFLVHWAGFKNPGFTTPMYHLLKHFEDAYYQNIKDGGINRKGVRKYLQTLRSLCFRILKSA